MNSLSGYKSANLIGSRSLAGVENVAVFSSVVHLGSNPPLLGFILRPTTVPRNTYENLKETGVFTINHITKAMRKEAHHTSAKYDKNISEFDMTALTPAYMADFYAPFVAESPIKIALQYVEEYHIKANNTLMIVGEIQFFSVVDEMLEKDGFLNLSKGNITVINGLDGYVLPEHLVRFGYQRPKEELNNKLS